MVMICVSADAEKYQSPIEKPLHENENIWTSKWDQSTILLLIGTEVARLTCHVFHSRLHKQTQNLK